MNPEKPDDVEIGSTSRMQPLVAPAATMTLISASIAFDWFGYSGIGRYHAPVGAAGFAFFGLATCSILAQPFAPKGLALLIGRCGIRDLRIANESILRDSIADVSACDYRRRKFVALKIVPPLELRLFITKSIQAMLHANRAMGVERVAIGVGGLMTDFDTRFGACTADHTAVRRTGVAGEQNSGALSHRCAGHLRVRRELESRPEPGSADRFHAPERCCESATSRKNQKPHHLFAQELGKLPVRNPLGACVVHCVRESAECPINPLC
jgi:hypothetical protein